MSLQNVPLRNRQNPIRNQCEGIVKIRYPLVILFSSMLFQKKTVLGYFQLPSVIAGGYPTKNMETPKDQNLGRCQNFHQLSPQHIYDAAQIAGPELGAWRRLATPCTMASPRDFNDRILELHNLPAARKSLPIHKSKKQIDEGFTDTLAHARTVTKAVGGSFSEVQGFGSDSRHVSILVNQQRVQVHPAIHPSGYD